MKKALKCFFFGILILLFVFICYFFVGKPPKQEKIIWGVNFSQKQAELLGLDWRETYLALLDDLEINQIKLLTRWDLIEPSETNYNFEDLDWQMREAEKRDAKILLVIGMKTGRWPECHEPEWLKTQHPTTKNKKLLEYIERVINRYKNSKIIWAWQVENEPFFPFGECPKIDKEFLEQEIALVKSLDPFKRPVVVSDSGEGSFWISSANVGDMVGTTMYKKVWFSQLKSYIYYPLPPVFYWKKAQMIEKIFNKKVIVTELQAEPWGPKLLNDLSLEEQEKTMSLQKFKYNIEFAQKTGLDTFYLWGGEWWYWLKIKQNNNQIWQEARKLF